jgi:hypothetical protein
VGEHLESCNLCECQEFLAWESIQVTVGDVNVEYGTDVVRHDTVDVEARGTEMASIKAAYRDRYDKPGWNLFPWDWRKLF